MGKLFITLAVSALALTTTFGKENPNKPQFVFFGFFTSPNAVERIREIPSLSPLKVKNLMFYTVVSYEPFFFSGSIAGNAINVTKKVEKEFQKTAEKVCKKWGFALVENFSWNITPVGQYNALITYRGDIVCLGF